MHGRCAERRAGATAPGSLLPLGLQPIGTCWTEAATTSPLILEGPPGMDTFPEVPWSSLPSPDKSPWDRNLSKPGESGEPSPAVTSSPRPPESSEGLNQ